MIIVYWYLFSNHYTRECIHTCERERNVAPLNSPRALYWPLPRGVGMHLMLTTLPPHPAWFPPKRGLACSATLHHTPVGPSVCTEAGCRLTLLVPPRLHRQLIYTYGSSPHNLTTFRFRHWLSSAPPPPASGASSAFSSSAFSTSRRSFLPPPVPLLHYFSRLCARTTLPPLRLG